MKRIHKIAITVGLTATVIGTILFGSFLPSNTTISEAAQTEEVELRFIFTTDIHGQLNSMDYEQGVDYSNGGLARAYDLIMHARNEKPDGNSFTFDVGDVMYDYTTEFIFAENQKEIQPIYRAMSLIGYDAITLGNHDFDYGYEYILNQLKGSGLMNRAIVSNVMDSKTGAHPFLENMLITRELETTNGKKVKVKIGIIGETIPNLTEKTESYTGVLKTEDIVANVKTQAAKLKELGADVVVVLAHSGIGPEKPELDFKNVSYALTNIDDVDVILCGHEHNVFPTDDTTSAYYRLPYVDKQTNLVNGKNLVMANDRGKSIGVVDLTLDMNEEEPIIIERASDVRFVSENKTTEDSKIRSLYGSWESKLSQYATDIIGEVEKGESIYNFYGLLKDNTAIQLLNDSRRSHAIQYINTEGKKYKDYPVIAASTYSSFGFNSNLDYINIKDKFTESDLVSMQPYNNYLLLYTISGKQLKEWLEWSASAYEVTTETTHWSDTTMSQLMQATNLKSLIKEDWLKDWSKFYIFDGIDYSINPMLQPRYDLSGNKISNSNRVREITYNGEAVTDEMVFMLAADKITKPSQANSGVEKQAVYSRFSRCQTILSNYIKELNKVGSILPTPDNNWKLQLGSDYQFIVNGPSYANTIAEASDWYGKLIKSEDNYNYYSATYKASTSDTLAPNVLVVATTTAATGTGYKVAVDATDLSGINTLKYKSGDYDLEYTGWNSASVVKDNSFSVNKNGIYSVYAEDNLGNKIVKKISIDNISSLIIGVPKIETYTNRKSAMKGTAEPGTTIVIETSTASYETIVSGLGTFSYGLPAQPSGSEISIYAKDGDTGRVSKKITIKVKRTGPNQPSLYDAYNNSEFLSGFTFDEDTEEVIAIVGNYVYVSSKNGKVFYENAAEIYDSNKKIIKTKLVISNSGKYKLDIKPQAVGTDVKIYSIDHLYRVSRLVTTTVEENAPNVPNVYLVSNIEHSITGNVNSLKNNTIFDVYAELNGTKYESQSDENGDFSIEIPEQLQANEAIDVYATDTVNGVKRKSASRSVKVVNIEQFIHAEEPIISLGEMTNRDDTIYGNYYNPDETVYIAVCLVAGDKINSKIYEVTCDSFGDFTYELSKPLPAGSKIYAMARFSDGDILDAAMTEIMLTEPTKPYIVTEITNNTKIVYVVTDKKSEVTVQIGAKKYITSKYAYDKELGAYVYALDTVRTNSGTQVKIYAANSIGKSPVFKSKIIKVAPDSPKVVEIFMDSTKIKGTIDVEQTNTKVYAKIGKKTYEGVINKDGNYTIKISKQKIGTIIYVWGSSNGDRGPLSIIKVQKK